MAGNRQTPILPLPDGVVAQIKSSAAVSSLSQVVLGLLSNSLDAKATKIQATIDFARGNCMVEDDGLGIPPIDFREQGGLGKLYCTSKYNSREPYLGRHGTFLASLAAVSLLTITSHHHDYYSHNSITFHHSAAIERQLPSLAHHEIHGKHGTRVTVRNLFGNLPVRVKQRSLLLEQKTECDRTWEILKRDIVGHLLSWQGPVSLKVRDAENKTTLNFSTSGAATTVDIHRKDANSVPSTKLHSCLNILSQASYIPIDEWSSWVPASASTSSIAISGAISLQPAPSKQVQFISLGLRPLHVDTGHNELYDEVNRRFALSSFGTVEDTVEQDVNEKVRQQSGERFRSDRYLKKQLKGRKGVDRHPMFFLRVVLKQTTSTQNPGVQFLDDNLNLQTIIDVLNALITQWMSIHQIQQKATRAGLIQPSPILAATSKSDEQCSTSVSKNQTCPTLNRTAIEAHTTRSGSTERKRTAKSAPSRPSERRPPRAFAEWSRVKSGKSDFFHNISSRSKAASENPPSLLIAPHSRDAAPGTLTGFETEPIPRGAFSTPSDARELSRVEKEQQDAEDTQDETMLWTDPLTKKSFILNARTGCVVTRQEIRPQSESAISIFDGSSKRDKKLLRLASRSATAEPPNMPWLRSVLESWDNPVFRPSDKQVPRVSILEQDVDHQVYTQSHHFQCSSTNMENFFNDPGMTGKSRLSRTGLRNAEVIAQVDKKFILSKMKRSDASVSDVEPGLLVLIDQHAADERIRVEALLAELCKPLPGGVKRSSYRSKCGYIPQVDFVVLEKPICFTIEVPDQHQFSKYAPRFAAWGILFDIETSKEENVRASGVSLYTLMVTTLPPVISERCKADPQVLISLLRSTVWKFAEDQNLPPLASTLAKDKSSSSWVRQIASCPQGLIDLLNSRACRSAIMFNDNLSLEECTTLVAKLAECVFPFTCAHGRPSMVPIIDTGRFNTKSEVLGLQETDHGNSNFGQAWKNWRKTQFGKLTIGTIV